jgi:hypothetical protein
MLDLLNIRSSAIWFLARGDLNQIGVRFVIYFIPEACAVLKLYMSTLPPKLFTDGPTCSQFGKVIHSRAGLFTGVPWETGGFHPWHDGRRAAKAVAGQPDPALPPAGVVAGLSRGSG